VTAVTFDAPIDVRAMWRRWRTPIAVVGFLLIAAVILALVENAPPSRPLDPSDPSHQGGRALAQLLRDRGVDVVAVQDVAGSSITAQTTVFVPDPTSLTRDDLADISSRAGSVVVIAPGRRELRALGVAGLPTPGGVDGRPSPDCSFEAAAVAGRVHYEGRTYAAPAAASRCYRNDIESGLFVAQSDQHPVVVFGSPRTLTNEWLDDEGDAALGLGLLGRSPRVAWVVPRPPTLSAADSRHRGLLDLLPDRLLWATLQLFIAVILLALWRSRRLGPVVAEPLPVVVRATETVEGRARLLRAARARDAAAASLRSATLERLRDRLGLAADSGRAAAVEPVARRSGWPAADVDRILYGPQPTDDAALLRLISELDQLDRAVRRS
jgi:Domain of unknown function (DUF4350)